MAKYTSKRFGFYFAVSIVLAVCFQLIMYVVLLDNTVGPFNISSLRAMDAPAAGNNLNAAVVVSEATARVSPSHLVEVEQWEMFLRMNDVPYEQVTEKELGARLPDTAVLILPNLICLSDASRLSIRKQLELGRGVIATGPVGLRDEKGAVRDWDFLKFLANVQHLRIRQAADPVFATFRGDTILSDALPGGYRLSLQPQDLTIAQAAFPDAFWSNWKLRPEGDHDGARSPSNSSVLSTAVATHTHHGPGRAVWFGFNPARAGITDIPQLLFSPLRWAGRKPVVIKASWPDAKTAGLVLVQNLEGDPADAADVTRYLEDENVPSTLMLDSTAVLPERLRSDKNVDFAWSGGQARPLAGLSTAQQAAVFDLGRRDTEQLIGRSIFGANAPFGLATAETPTALNDAGYRYYLEDLNMTSAVPQLIDYPVSMLFPLQRSYVARIFATGTSDFQAIAHFDGSEPTDISLKDTFDQDMDRLSYLHGLYTLPFHTYLLGSPEYRNVLRALVADAKQRDFWVASAAGAAEWWIARHTIDVDFEEVNPHRFRIGITNRGNSDVDGFTTRLYLPVPISTFDLQPSLLQLHPPLARRLPEEDAIEIVMPHLKGQTHYPFLLQVN